MGSQWRKICLYWCYSKGNPFIIASQNILVGNNCCIDCSLGESCVSRWKNCCDPLRPPFSLLPTGRARTSWEAIRYTRRRFISKEYSITLLIILLGFDEDDLGSCVCGGLLTSLSVIIVIVTLPFSLCVCLKVKWASITLQSSVYFHLKLFQIINITFSANKTCSRKLVQHEMQSKEIVTKFLSFYNHDFDIFIACNCAVAKVDLSYCLKTCVKSIRCWKVDFIMALTGRAGVREGSHFQARKASQWWIKGTRWIVLWNIDKLSACCIIDCSQIRDKKFNIYVQKFSTYKSFWHTPARRKRKQTTLL